MPDRNEEELKSKVHALVHQRFGGDFERMFEHYSRYRQGDERIDSDELNELLKDAGVGNFATRGAWVKGILDRLDTNRDRALSWAELNHIVNAYSTR
jgi:hypothetical protein